MRRDAPSVQDISFPRNCKWKGISLLLSSLELSDTQVYEP